MHHGQILSLVASLVLSSPLSFVSHCEHRQVFFGSLRDVSPISSWLVTRDISDGVRCDTEISVDVVSCCSILDKVARRLTPLLKLAHSFPKSLFISSWSSHLMTLSFFSKVVLHWLIVFTTSPSDYVVFSASLFSFASILRQRNLSNTCPSAVV